MNEFDFIGPLKNEMSTFVLLKRSVGNKYQSEVGVLKRFDRYLAKNYPVITGLPKCPSPAGAQSSHMKNKLTSVHAPLSSGSLQNI